MNKPHLPCRCASSAMGRQVQARLTPCRAAGQEQSRASYPAQCSRQGLDCLLAAVTSTKRDFVPQRTSSGPRPQPAASQPVPSHRRALQNTGRNFAEMRQHGDNPTSLTPVNGLRDSNSDCSADPGAGGASGGAGVGVQHGGFLHRSVQRDATRSAARGAFPRGGWPCPGRQCHQASSTRCAGPGAVLRCRCAPGSISPTQRCWVHPAQVQLLLVCAWAQIT